MKVKICGIKTLEAAKTSIEAGADFLGFNFVKSSKRYIDHKKAKEIISGLNDYLCHCEPASWRVKQSLKIYKDRHAPIESGLAMTEFVGIFQNEKIDVVNKLVNYLKLDFVQLHGSESPEYIKQIINVGVIKTFSLPRDFNTEETIKKMKKYKADYFLLDREIQGRGELLNPKKIARLTSVFPIILGGGLTVENVYEMITIAKPQVVDVAGGVETNKVKDKKKIIKFIKDVEKYDF